MRKPRPRSYAIFKKELIEVSRDPRTLAIILFMPILMLILYGYGVSTDIRNIPMAILNMDRSPKSREFIQSFTSSKFFTVQSYAAGPRDIDRAIDSGNARIGLIIPPGFGRRLEQGKSSPVFIAVDGSEPNTASAAISYISTIVGTFSEQVVVSNMQVSRLYPVDLRPRIWFNPELRSINFIVPGLVAIILMMMSALLTSGTIAREREHGTMEPLIASPIKKWELMAGKIAAYTLIAFADIALVLLVGTIWFQVPFRGSIPLLLIMSGLFLTSSLGLGLLISSRSETQQSATLLAFIATLIPGLLLSGFIFPISSMPVPVQVITYLIPARYFLVIVRGIFLKGTGLGDIWMQALPMTLLGLLLFILSIRAFRKQL
ncbi:MAG TPA: ABC transporter permease [Armatimonadetes bacterium]|nr:ABC transporter permease [Armatimonadota bacterium]